MSFLFPTVGRQDKGLRGGVCDKDKGLVTTSGGWQLTSRGVGV